MGRGKAACKKVLCTEKPKVLGVIGVNPQGFDSGVLFCGVCNTSDSVEELSPELTPTGGIQLAPAGEPDANARASLAPLGEATCVRTSLMEPLDRHGGLDRPSNLGRGLDSCALGDGAGDASPREDSGWTGEAASVAIESARRLPYEAVNGRAEPGDGVGPKEIRVGVARQGVLRCADAFVEDDGEAVVTDS